VSYDDHPVFPSFPTRRSSDLLQLAFGAIIGEVGDGLAAVDGVDGGDRLDAELRGEELVLVDVDLGELDAFTGVIGDDFIEDGAKDRKSTRLNSSHSQISYAVF